MAQIHEWMFYELMWRARSSRASYPLPWWVQQYFARWTDAYDAGLFDSKEAAFASNAYYRYWCMVGVKDQHQESLVGQAGEVEPVYDSYALSFFLFDPETHALHFPQFPVPNNGAPGLDQRVEDNYLPVIMTTYASPLGIEVTEKVFATVVGAQAKSATIVRLRARLTAATARSAWLCVAVTPAGPSGFQRHDKAGRYLPDRRLSFLRYVRAEARLEVNTSWGPAFDTAPERVGLYGNDDSYEPDWYLANNPFHGLASGGELNEQDSASDYVAGLCTAAFAWPIALTPADPVIDLDIRLPVDDFRGADDLLALRSIDAGTLEGNNRAFWTDKLDGSGLQAILPAAQQRLFDLFRLCRANLLILADDGQIHPGPTIYDSFWVRDSSIEGIACALSGDSNLAERQFGYHYPTIYNLDDEWVGPVNIHGFFGGEHEKNDREWDSNGQALWAIGRFDRIRGAGQGFGSAMFAPYVVGGSRWLRDNRSPFGLLHSGWSAEHIGDKDKPHYWDDFWAVAGLWEAARLAERIGAPQAGEIWAIYDSLRQATADSIRWVLAEQQRRGFWETFIPTGPADVGRLDSTMIGALAYFHPCRLYMDAKLGADIDQAARVTLETIWSHFIEGGFRHDAAWNCYGPYLTLQLAHAFLFTGDVERMRLCLTWSIEKAGYAQIRRGEAGDMWQVVTGAWNEQHCYPIASDFAEFPTGSWYMGDIPHGWACAELLLLLRDMLFFEADEDGSPHIYLAPGIPPEWLAGGEVVGVDNAPTIFGDAFGFRLVHDLATRSVSIDITQPPPANVRIVYLCRLGSGVESAEDGGQPLLVDGRNVWLPAGTRRATVHYR